MMIGLATHPLGQLPYPACAVCELVPVLPCAPRERTFRAEPAVGATIKRGGDVQLYNQKDAVAVECLGCVPAVSVCVDVSFESARILLFVSSGNVYARAEGGRRGQIIDIAASAVLSSGDEKPLNKRIIIE